MAVRYTKGISSTEKELQTGEVNGGYGRLMSCKQQGLMAHTAYGEALLKPSGHYMYRQFNIQQFYVLPTHCIYVFCVDLRTNSDYFPTQH